MKVAVVFHGHFRCFDRTWPTIKTHLIDRVNPDIFAFAWTDSMGYYLDPFQTPDHENHPGFVIGEPVSDEYIDEVKSRLNPKVFITDHYSNHDAYYQSLVDSWRYTTTYLHVPVGCHRPKGVLGLVWSRSQIIKAMSEYERTHNFKYDLVIVTRYDIKHNYPIDISCLNPEIVNASGPADRHPWDYWTAGPSDLIGLWGQQWDGMQEMIDLGLFNTNPHRWQTVWFEHKNIKWQPVDFRVNIER